MYFHNGSYDRNFNSQCANATCLVCMAKYRVIIVTMATISMCVKVF